MNGPHGDDETIIQWIRLLMMASDRIWRPILSRLNITAEEAGLRLTNGRPDSQRDTIFQRYRDGYLTAFEALAEIRQWRRNQAAGYC